MSSIADVLLDAFSVYNTYFSYDFSTPLFRFAELTAYNLVNQVTLHLNHVKKRFGVPFSHLDTLVQTYRLLASGTIPGVCQVETLHVGCC